MTLQSPAVVFTQEANLSKLLGPLLFFEDLESIRVAMARFLLQPVPEWVVFRLPESEKAQGQFLKFLEDYSGNVALFTEKVCRLIPPLESRMMGCFKDQPLIRYEFGEGVTGDSKYYLHEQCRTPLALKAVKFTKLRFHQTGTQLKILRNLDSI